MEIIIHRGTRQIGGCATEIRTAHTRILIDFGAELPDRNGHTSADTLRIDGLNRGKPDFAGVFLTHYHGDHLGLVAQVPEKIPIYIGGEALEIFSAYADRVGGGLARVSGRIRPLDALVRVTVGDLTVTPIPADHSAYGAFMYLIEGEGKRVLHTGDFRLHGFRGKATPKLLKRYSDGVDVLIIEGTQLSRNSRGGLSERGLQEKLKEEIAENKYVFALCASTHIDRLASFYRATPRGRYFVCDRYQYDLLKRVAAGTDSPWYQFRKMLFYGENLKLRERGFVMPVRANREFSRVVSRWPEAILIYSMWDGYLDGRSPALSEFVRPFEEAGRLRRLHSSGHAAPADIRTICNQIRPSHGVIPIHTEYGEGLRKLGITCPVLTLEDRELFRL